MGLFLESTTFVLWAEDCHWESFLRSRSNDEPLVFIVKSMEILNRKNKIVFFLADALKINPWSLFCRYEIVVREREITGINNDNDNNDMGPWESLFKSQDYTLSRIQSLARGYLLRKFWESIYKPQLLEARKSFDFSRIVAAQWGEERLVKIVLKRLNHWYKMFVELTDKKNKKAILIQTVGRKYNAIRRYRWMLWRARRANWIFLEACEFIYDRRRLTAMRIWHKFWLAERKHSMSTIIAISVSQLRDLSIVRANLHKIYPVVKQRNLKLFKFMIDRWVIRYKDRLKVKARVKIRFFIRNCLTRVERYYY